MFKAYGAFNNNTSIKKKKIAVITVGRTFLQRQQSVDLFLTAIEGQPTRDPYERRLFRFFEKDGS
jgi:hypothetical protein